MSCRFCGSKKILQVCAKCSDLFSSKMPNAKEWSSGYNFVPGLMQDDDSGDYVNFDVCLACQRVQEDLFEYADKPKKWTLPKKLEDLKDRVDQLSEALQQHAPTLEYKINLLRAVDRCLPGLVRDLEKTLEGVAS